MKIGFPLSVQYCLLCDPLMFYCCQSLNVAGCPLGIPGLLGSLPALRIPPPRILAQVPPSRFPPIFLQRIRNNYINEHGPSSIYLISWHIKFWIWFKRSHISLYHITDSTFFFLLSFHSGEYGKLCYSVSKKEKKIEQKERGSINTMFLRQATSCFRKQRPNP